MSANSPRPWRDHALGRGRGPGGPGGPGGAAAQPKRRALGRSRDITDVPTKERWLYLAVVLDLFRRSILGWSVADSLPAPLVTTALQRALDSGQVARGALFHADRGASTAPSCPGLVCFATTGVRASARKATATTMLSPKAASL